VIEKQAKGYRVSNHLISLPQKTFLILQVVLAGALVLLAAYRSQAILGDRSLPPLRPESLKIDLQCDNPAVVTDDQLRRVLLRLRPVNRGAENRVNEIEHALRLWGSEADFGDPAFLTGMELRSLLTDHRHFAQMYGSDELPLLMDEDNGVGIRTLEGPRTSAHADHTLSVLTEVNTPLDFPVVTPTRRTSFREIVERSLREFSLNQIEYEWSIAAYAVYLPPVTRWRTSEGQEVTFDRLAVRIMRESLPRGVCLGNHRLYTLVVLLRIDDQFPILSPEMRIEITEFLRRATVMLVQHQHPDGFWNDLWPFETPGSSAASDRVGDRLAERLIATGHALEWWAMAPPELHPPRSVLAAAGQWLVKTVDSLTDGEIHENYVYLTHVGRALAIWRGQEAFDAWIRLNAQVESQDREENSR
jgi:hypothetical protein